MKASLYATAALPLLVVLAGCGLLSPPGVEPPAICGFPPGTKVTVVGPAPASDYGLGIAQPPGVADVGVVYVTTEPIRRPPEEDVLVRWWCMASGPDPETSTRAALDWVPAGWTPPDQ